MNEILQSILPPDLVDDSRLPGISPLEADGWFQCDDAYAAQMAYRRQLIAEKRAQVIWEGGPDAREPCAEILAETCRLMPSLGFDVDGDQITCPDGIRVSRVEDSALTTLGRSIQQDICILTKRNDEHVLSAAVLCFPASWTLSEKAERPLTGVHRPVEEYTQSLAVRVQRLFDGVQVGRPLRRNNYLFYENPDLFQPVSEAAAPRPMPVTDRAGYIRAERQCIFRLPKSKAVVFSIHTYVVRHRP